MGTKLIEVEIKDFTGTSIDEAEDIFSLNMVKMAKVMIDPDSSEDLRKAAKFLLECADLIEIMGG